MKFPDGKKEVEEYYVIAPVVVSAIDSRLDSQAIYKEIYFKWIKPEALSIQRNNYNETYKIYCGMVNELNKKYGFSSRDILTSFTAFC